MGRRSYPALTIKDLCEKLCKEQNCTREDIYQIVDGKGHAGVILRRPATHRSPWVFPFLPEFHDEPLTDYSIRIICKGVGLDADVVFGLLN